jgi:VanZ family protein
VKNRPFFVVFGLSLLIFYISESYLNQFVVYIAQAFNYSNMFCSMAHFVRLFSPNKETDLVTVHNQVPDHPGYLAT